MLVNCGVALATVMGAEFKYCCLVTDGLGVSGITAASVISILVVTSIFAELVNCDV